MCFHRMDSAAKRPKRSFLPATPVGKAQNGALQDVDNDVEDADDCDDDFGGGSKVDSPAVASSAKRKVAEFSQLQSHTYHQ